MEDIKVIFLDVDGVLNSVYDGKLYKQQNNIKGSILYDNVEDRPLKLLKEIVDKTRAKIVLSSSWRYGHTKYVDMSVFGTKLYAKLVKALKNYDLDLLDITPVLSDKSRGAEIAAWLSDNKTIYNVTDYIILDDDMDFLPEQLPYLVKTTYDNGLTVLLKDLAISLLNRS